MTTEIRQRVQLELIEEEILKPFRDRLMAQYALLALLQAQESAVWSLFPETLEFFGLHFDQAENAMQGTYSKMFIPVYGHRRAQPTFFHDVMAAADTLEYESLFLKKTQHLLPSHSRQLIHAQPDPLYRHDASAAARQHGKAHLPNHIHRHRA